MVVEGGLEQGQLVAMADFDQTVDLKSVGSDVIVRKPEIIVSFHNIWKSFEKPVEAVPFTSLAPFDIGSARKGLRCRVAEIADGKVEVAVPTCPAFMQAIVAASYHREHAPAGFSF